MGVKYMEEPIQPRLPDKEIAATQTPSEEEIDKGFRGLLDRFKVIRDSTHGDIWITEVEKEIIDKPIFQRLRRIKQLGSSDLVYPGARHTRFEHSIGTLHMAHQIIEALKKNFEVGLSNMSLSSEDIFITRIVALIHDLAHVCHGHTLEDEGRLFGDDKQWLNKTRREAILEEIFLVVEKRLSTVHIPNDRIQKLRNEVENILIAEEKGEDEIHELERPYIADIVSNTICADLLDYLKRDSYNTGLQMTYDPRILSYFVLQNYAKDGKDKVEKTRLAILLERKKGPRRRDILSECITLLRMRYSLAEKVYYHRVKSIFAAMVIKMVHCALRGRILTEDDLMWQGDDILLYIVLSSKQEDKQEENSQYVKAAKKLADALTNRKLYREIYSNVYTNEDVWNKLQGYADKDQRYGMEEYLENLFDVDPGSVIIYAPKLDKGKAAETKILRTTNGEPYVKTLTELSKEYEYNSTIGREIQTLEDLYKSLWKFYVLLDAECARDEERERLNKVCKEVLEDGKLGENAVLLRCNKLQPKSVTTSQVEKVCRQLASQQTLPRLMKQPGKHIDSLLHQVVEGYDDSAT